VLRALRVDTKQNKEARHVLPVNQENIKHKNNKQNASTAMQENKLPMMPVLLPVTSAFKGAIKQKRARLLVWGVYLENIKQKLKNKNVKNAKLAELLQA